MANIDACLSRKTDDWKTPTQIMKKVIEKGWKDTFQFQADYDEFENNYYEEKLFINPPFSKMKKVAKWIREQLRNQNEIILIIPSRTDTEYMHELLDLNPTIYMFKGRLHYNDSNSAPFPTIALIFKKVWLHIPVYDYGDIEKFNKKYL